MRLVRANITNNPRHRRPSPALAIAILALCVSLSGTAWAVGTISGKSLDDRSVSHLKIDKGTLTGSEINKSKLGTVPRSKQAANALRLGGFPALDYTENVWADETSTPMTLPSRTAFKPVMKMPFVNDVPKAGFLNLAEVQATNPDKTSAVTLTIRLAIDGKLEPGSYEATIGPSETQSMFGVLKCNGMPGGDHTIELDARSSGTLDFGTRADDGLRPIVVPPGGHSGFIGEG